MKQMPFIGLVLLVNCSFIFLLVYKNSSMVGLTYKKQQHEKMYAQLVEQKEHLEQELSFVQSRAAVKKYAQQELKMGKIKRKDIFQIEKDIQATTSC